MARVERCETTKGVSGVARMARSPKDSGVRKHARKHVKGRDKRSSKGMRRMMRAVLLAAEHVAKQPERKAADLDQECIRRAVVVKGLAEPERVDIR